ncbi:hypothetical protein CBER1_07179 [Cercospora berteroae]|uniref:Uncharacterized protein n=1 Tax=Cercospora berteroae TaxID=357750 RepID=A0A2S6BRY9_9PEZI|nr:hypothetical protein CBER1_07179 [Cercospora berteroae]
MGSRLLVSAALVGALVGQTWAAGVLEHRHAHGDGKRHRADISDSLDKRQLPDFAQRNLNTIREIYGLTVYPNNVPILKQGCDKALRPGLFSPYATGRVSPVGDFTGFNDSCEYFFALAPNPEDQEFQGLGIYQADVVEFTSGCPNIAASVVYLRTAKYDQNTRQIDPNVPVSTLAQVAFWQFDAYGQVERYHAWITNLEAWIKAGTGVDFSALLYQKFVPVVLCPGIQQRCTGQYQQYLDVTTCILELELKPFGSFDEVWGDNVACRLIHLILTQVRPDIHCPHVGPTGGGKCVDINYSVDYFSDLELFGLPEGNVFTCGGPLTDPMNPAAVGPFSGSNGNPLPGEAQPPIPDVKQALGPLGGLLDGIVKRMPAWL